MLPLENLSCNDCSSKIAGHESDFMDTFTRLEEAHWAYVDAGHRPVSFQEFCYQSKLNDIMASMFVQIRCIHMCSAVVTDCWESVSYEVRMRTLDYSTFWNHFNDLSCMSA